MVMAAGQQCFDAIQILTAPDKVKSEFGSRIRLYTVLQ
jgi:hypothetical protein